MSKLLKDIKKNLKIGIEKTEEIGKVGKIKMDIMGIQHSLEKAFGDLGEIAYSYLKDPKKGELKADKKTVDLIKKIDQYHSDIKAKEKEILTVRKNYEQAKESASKKSAAEAKPKSESPVDVKAETTAPKAAPKAKTAEKPKPATKKPATKSSKPKSGPSSQDTQVS